MIGVRRGFSLSSGTPVLGYVLSIYSRSTVGHLPGYSRTNRIDREASCNRQVSSVRILARLCRLLREYVQRFQDPRKQSCTVYKIACLSIVRTVLTLQALDH